MSSRNKHHGKRISRRKFLGQASCAAIGTTTLLSSYLQLGMMNALSAKALRMPSPVAPPNGEYKALVCILLAGGNDSFNMLAPISNEQYGVYATTRSNLALAQGDFLPLNYTDGQGVQYGLHPAMPEAQQLFNDGKLALVSNVGTLIEPTTKIQILNETANLPLGLLSHADQIQQWQTSVPQDRSAKGWAGRMADIISTMNDNQDVSMNISLAGTNVFQTGNNGSEYAIEPDNGSIGMVFYDDPNLYNQLITEKVESILNQEYQDIFKQTYRDRVQNSQAQHVLFNEAIAGVPPFATQFTAGNPVSESLSMVARSIASHETLGHSRQTYFVLFGGWDHHDEILNNQMNMLSVVSQAMSEFQTAMEEVNMADCVTTFTISDFARTLTSNGNGTDHAWGGNVMVMGGAVNGGQIYGQYPDLDLGNDLEVGGGVILPTTSVDEYFGELALWMGVPTSEFEYILPNLNNFADINLGGPLGFLNI